MDLTIAASELAKGTDKSQGASINIKNNTQTNHGIIWSSSAIMHGRSYILQVQQINNAIRQNNL